MATGRRALAAGLALLPFAAAGQGGPRGELWFDPTQLPSFTGTVDRYLANPRGETDTLTFKEGPQVVFPPDLAPAVRAAAAPGATIVVWGIRARNAPVITMLAFAPSAEAPPAVVERVYWRLGGRQAGEGAVPLSAAGTVRQSYYTPQGEVAGAILEDGTVVLVPPGAAEGAQELLKPGANLAAEGMGHAGAAGRALVAARLGPAPDALRPLQAR